MANDQFDDDGAPPRPDEHEREMADLGIGIEGAEVIVEGEDAFVSAEVSVDRITTISAHLARTMNTDVLPLDPFYFEIGVALAHSYLETTRMCLAKTESLILFQKNRDQMLDVLGRTIARINEIPYTELATIETDSEARH